MKEASPVWIRRLEGAVSRLQEIPLWGKTPAFPWDKITEKLKERFGIKSLQIKVKQSRVLSPEEFASSLGVDPLHLGIELTPLEGNAFWLMPKSEIEKLIVLFLTQEGNQKGFVNESIQIGYAYFLFLKILHLLNEEYAFGDLTLQIASKKELPTEQSLCLDLSIQLDRETLWARILCTDALIEAFNHYFTAEPLRASLLTPALPLPLNLEVGRTLLSNTSWQKIKRGDLVLLDKCSFDPTQQKGSGALTLAGTPLFDVRIKENEVKILEYAFYQEETHMTRSKDEHHEEKPLPSEEPNEHLWSPDAEESLSTEKLIAAQEIPLSLTVEIARMTLPLEKVIQLKPGNLLDLKVNPELAVSLTINGQPVAKGELVKIGESLGVKILALHE